jgi:N-acetylgalactosamine-6-sulfatase
MIDRRQFVKKLGGGMLCAGFLGLSGTGVAYGSENNRKRPPNIVFVLCDDLGWGDFGCYGNQEIKTPNIDRLAQQGLLFTNYYVNSPVCSPTRAGIMTGRFPSELGIHYAMGQHEWNVQCNMPDYLDPEVPTITKMLQEAGYRIGHFGKWHLGGPYNKGTPSPAKYGIDEYATLYTPGWPDYRKAGESRSEWAKSNIDVAIEFIEKHQNKPFYLNVWLFDVHSTLDPSDEQMEPYKDRWMLVGSEPTSREYRGTLQVYYAAVTNMDKQIGRLIDRLDQLGLSGDTLVVVTSDNGPSPPWAKDTSHSGGGSAGPFRGCKGSLYEGGIRVPFIARWPGKVPAGKVDDKTIISGADLFPSFCRVAGLTPREELELDGEDLSAAIFGACRERTKPLMWEFRFPPNGGRARVLQCSPLLAIRQGKWKLLMNPDRSRVELYDLTKDPSEVDNVADANGDLVATLSAPLLAWHKSLPDADKIPEGAGTNNYPWPESGPQD